MKSYHINQQYILLKEEKIKMKNLFKRLALYTLVAAILVSAVFPVLAAEPADKCKITINGQKTEWKLEPFLAYGPQGDVFILIPMRDLFTSLGYTVDYEPVLNRSIFTADKNSDYFSFWVDVKTGQLLEEGEELKKNAVNQVYLINSSLYITDYRLKEMAKTFLAGSTVEIDYVYNKKITFEYNIIKYSGSFPIQGNLLSFILNVSAKYPDHPYIGDQYTKYNTGEYILGAAIRENGLNNEKTKDFWTNFGAREWDGFDNQRFYTGEGEQNQLTGKTYGSMYSIAWELMDAVAEEINSLRKQNDLAELTVDHSLCFISVGAKNSKVDTVFDNAISNLENSKAAHTFAGKTILAECITSCPSFGVKDPATQKYDNSTPTVAKQIANAWYKSIKGHREIIMNPKYKTMGILVVITDTLATDSYIVLK
jgi:hypothetical protein